MCDSSQRELQNEERRELGLEPWKVQSRQTRTKENSSIVDTKKEKGLSQQW